MSIGSWEGWQEGEQADKEDALPSHPPFAMPKVDERGELVSVEQALRCSPSAHRFGDLPSDLAA